MPIYNIAKDTTFIMAAVSAVIYALITTKSNMCSNLGVITMKRLYSAWGKKEKGEADCLIEGEGPPRFANGKLDTSSLDFYFFIEANTWEEAMAIYHLRQGWEPYRTNASPANCPDCGAIYYPEGSAQCWRCDDGS
jgi:hypothetical protein